MEQEHSRIGKECVRLLDTCHRSLLDAGTNRTGTGVAPRIILPHLSNSKCAVPMIYLSHYVYQLIFTL